MAMWRKRRPRAGSFVAKAIRFVGEQDGVPERELKERVAPLLVGSGAVERAYLARVAYGSSSPEVVALCLRATRPEDALLGEIGVVFASMFGRDQHLDMLFIDGDQDRELARVCPPFYKAGK
jgi:hypothetical protein